MDEDEIYRALTRMADEHQSDIELHVYKDSLSRWVFDDADKGIKQEPFVAGMDFVMDHITRDIPDAVEMGFNLHMDSFIGSNSRPYEVLTHSEGLVHPILGQSNYYDWIGTGRRVWICNVLYRYYDRTPQVLCVWATPANQ